MRFRILSGNGHKVVALNRRKAIREKCINCSGWSAKDVSNCPLADCPLYWFRMGKGSQNPEERDNAIKKYCYECMAGKRSEIPKCVSKTCPLFPFRMRKTDRSAEIVSSQKKERIAHVLGPNIDEPIQLDLFSSFQP